MGHRIDSKGYSLVEVLVVVALVGVIATIATMGSDFVQKHRLTAASRELLGDLQKIRQDAMTRSNPALGANSRGFGIRFSSNTTYTTFEFNDCTGDFIYDANGCAGNREEAGTSQKTLPSSVTVTIGDAGDPTGNILIYDRRGMARDNNNWNAVGGGGRTYVLRRAGVAEVRCVTVTPVRIREGRWDGANCNIS